MTTNPLITLKRWLAAIRKSIHPPCRTIAIAGWLETPTMPALSLATVPVQSLSAHRSLRVPIWDRVPRTSARVTDRSPPIPVMDSRSI